MYSALTWLGLKSPVIPEEIDVRLADRLGELDPVPIGIKPSSGGNHSSGTLVLYRMTMLILNAVLQLLAPRNHRAVRSRCFVPQHDTIPGALHSR